VSVLEVEARNLVESVATAAAVAPNEENLRHEVEKALEESCRSLGIAWSAYQLDRTPHGIGQAGRTRFVDVAHGAVVIEYEPPTCFRGGAAAAVVGRAQDQAAEYAELLSDEEGRPLGEYSLIAWDGTHISFGRRDGAAYAWEAVQAFDFSAAVRLLTLLRDDGAPLVHPRIISQMVGPESELGAKLMPKLFVAIRSATTQGGETTRTRLLHTEWRRLFGQVIAVQSDRLREPLRSQGQRHGQDYEADAAAYLYALNTYIALVAKAVAALSLPSAASNMADADVPISTRISALESGQLFVDAGVVNMLNGDFFSWYRDDPAWETYEAEIDELFDRLRVINFDVSRKSAESTRDLFKGLYMSFVPRALRHALGEYYTPDWLASHALDQIGWEPQDGLIDPTAGSGTFLLEAVKRRRAADENVTAAELIDGISGLDLNPMAVLAARASLVVVLADRLDPSSPIRLPVFLADAINPATVSSEGIYAHRLQTELGTMEFAVPASLVQDARFFELFGRLRDLIDANFGADRVAAAIRHEFDLAYLGEDEWQRFEALVGTLATLHERGWNGIWCSVLADRFAAGAIPPSTHVVGNPPWVKWSHLPPEYAEFIKDRCLQLGVFSVDRWVGGIESDISIVITYEAAEKYLTAGGCLAFFITGTVFSNESSQGFRRWRINDSETDLGVEFVEDYAAVSPFEGVTNHATLLVLRKGVPTRYPVPYRVWAPPRKGNSVKRVFDGGESFRAEAAAVELLATPVPGSDTGPWLKGTAAQQAVWSHLFALQSDPPYRARKGVTTDANGIFFVRVAPASGNGVVQIENEPSLGRRREVQQVRRIVESTHLFPLLRGEGVRPFRAAPDPELRILVPQRGMHGDDDLPVAAPRTHRFLAGFEEILSRRSSYRRFQQRTGAPYWSLWTVGPYTFAPYKVAWRELSGGRFAAAYVGSVADPLVGAKVVVPDHKVYFVPCDTEDEAAYLTGFLNSPLVAEAVSAYAAQLSLGVSVVEYLRIPEFDPESVAHLEIADVAKTVTAGGGVAEPGALARLDEIVAAELGVPRGVIDDVHADATNELVRDAEKVAT
jgi:hypothetical protein